MAYTTIDKPTDYFNTKLYSGNGSTQSITGVGFQPDFVWIKSRTTAGWHNLFDTNRGATKRIFTNDAGAEQTTSNSLTSFDSDGFSLGSNGDVNGNTQNQVSWNWLAGGTASSNTDGSITSSVSASTTAGFSIVSYTGTGSSATIGHGLGVSPSMIICKNREAGQNWATYHVGIGETKAVFLDNTDASVTASSYWNNTAPTSTVFSVNNSGDTNKSGDDTIAYCFAEKKGFSKFGSYTGNGSTDGTFVYTGFKPAFVIYKSTNLVDSWFMQDTTRDTYNPADLRLEPNGSGAEGTSANFAVDYLSNGFKIRANHSQTNNSGTNYIYMAFAESPFVTSTGIPTTAR